MTRPRPDTLFRIGALVGCGIIALPWVIRALAGGLTAGNLVMAATLAGMAAVFGAAFWFNTREDAAGRSRTLTIGLLVLQVLIALQITDFFFLVAAQAPFVFTPRGALVWLAGQLAAFTVLVVLVALAGDQVAIPEMAGMPDSLAVPVTIVYLAGWQVFSFSIGYLAASEQRSRRELEQRARELLATQQMLADSSRVAERVQISRELHDTLGHNLAVLNVNLELARHLTDGRAGDAVTKAQTVARLLLADVREVVHAIADDREIDLRGALIMLCEGAHSPAVHFLAAPIVIPGGFESCHASHVLEFCVSRCSSRRSCSVCRWRSQRRRPFMHGSRRRRRRRRSRYASRAKRRPRPACSIGCESAARAAASR